LYQVLQVQITNELDPFFFYSLEVNEDDFQSLKVEQCILVDFATFPYKFIELLEQCIVSACADNPRFATHPAMFGQCHLCILKTLCSLYIHLMTLASAIFDMIKLLCNFKTRGTGRFLAVLHLRTGDSTLSVVETNQFKHLSHLSLVFRQGNDTVLKQFLAGRLAEYKVRDENSPKFMQRFTNYNTYEVPSIDYSEYFTLL